jgi:hypothetical protein
MFKKILAGLALTVATLLSAQQPQTVNIGPNVNPIYAVNSKYTNGVAPGYWSTAAATGLTLNISAGTANCNAVVTDYAGGTLTMSNNSTNYVFINSTGGCIPAVNTSGFTTSHIPLAIVTTSVGNITTIKDTRTMFFLGLAGSGSITGSGSACHLAKFSGTTVIGDSALCDDGSIVSSTEPIEAVSASATEPPFQGTNNAVSSAVIGAAGFVCPNITTTTADGCTLEVGKDFTPSTDGVRYAIQYHLNSTLSLSEAWLTFSHAGPNTPAFKWRTDGTAFLPQLPNIPCLGTGTGGILGAGACGTGSVNSVGLTLPASLFSVAGSPITNSGTLAASFISQAANLFFASPDGSSGVPTMRAIAPADLPVGTNAALGALKCDGTTTSCLGGIISAVATGSGTVNAGNSGQLAYYPSNGTAVSGTNALPNGTTATTQAVGDNSTKAATDAFVLANAGSSAPILSSDVYNGFISGQLNASNTVNSQFFSGGGIGSGCHYWEAAPAYGTSAYIIDTYYFIRAYPTAATPNDIVCLLNAYVALASSGNLPIAVSSGGSGIYVSGCQTDSTTKTQDGNIFVGLLLQLLYQKNAKTALSWLTSNAAVVKTAVQAVPLSGGLVTSPSAHPFVGWGYHDALVNTGADLVPSEYLYAATTFLANASTINGNTTDAAIYSAIASGISSALGSTSSVLWNSGSGMYNAATINNAQIDTLGSALSCQLKLATSAMCTSISNYFVTNYSTLVFKGFVRMSNTNWANVTTTPSSNCGRVANGYQNGNWSFMNDAISDVIRVTNPTKAAQLLTDYANSGSVIGYEWIDSGGDLGYPTNLSTPAGSAYAANAYFPGSIVSYPSVFLTSVSCGTAQTCATFYGPANALLLNTVDNNLNGWSTWSYDTTNPPSNITLTGVGQAFANQTGAFNTAIVNNKVPSSANYTVSGTFTVANNAAYSVQVFGRIQGLAVNTAYYVICGTNVSNNIQIRKVVAGSDSMLVQTAISWASGATHTISLQLNGTTLTAFVDGVSTITITDSAIGPAGLAGFGMGTGSTTTNQVISDWRII